MLINPEILNSELINKTFIEKIYYFNEVDSTNEYAKRTKDEDNILIVSEYQTAGRGRFDRNWESEKGKNLTFTIKKKFNLENKHLQIINFYFSYFLLQSVEKFIVNYLNLTSGPDLEVKWPNDILLSGKKLSGLLIERNHQKNFHIGIGLNVNQKKFNPEYEYKTTSLKNLFKKDIDRNKLLTAIIKSFNDNLRLITKQKYSEIFDLWRRKCKMIGKTIYFTESKNVKNRGRVIEIKIDGRIVIKVNDKEKVFYSGEIEIPHLSY